MKSRLASWWAWLDERSGLGAVWKALFARRVPEAKGPFAWAYTLGSATLVVFVIQVVTGVLLAMNYVPSPDRAYDSVRYIDSKVVWGAFVRGIHHWGSSFMVVLVAAHMLRVFFAGSYKYPRELTWISGLGLFVLTMGASFTGYLLPWDQKAYWATAVGTNMAGQAPVIGSALTKILRGGAEMGAATLTRFYSFHMLAIPIGIGALIGAHLFLVIWHGISAPPERRKSRGDRP